MKKRWVLIAILLILSFSRLSAVNEPVVVTSSYDTADFLQFQYGPPTPLAGFAISDTGITPSNLCALLGTLTISTNGNNLFDPSLININVSPTVAIEGYVRDANGTISYAENIPATLMAITVIEDEFVEAVPITGSTVQLVSSSGNIFPGKTTSMSTYIVLIAADMEYDYYIPGVIYSLDDESSIGTFGVSADGQGQEETTVIPISVDEIGTVLDAPFIPTSPAPGDEVDIPFEGDGFPFTHQYVFEILDNPMNFDLQQAILGTRPVIATVQLKVTNAQENTEYGVEIAFTSKDPAGFKLHLDGDLTQHGIPYQLYFDYDLNPIPHSTFIEWGNLFVSGENTGIIQRNITVSVNDGPELGEAPQGQYSDTVTVNIIPLESLGI
jgi:hypothetical protein